MNMVKKTFVMVLIVAFVSLGLTSCGDKSEHPASKDPSKKASSSEHPAKEASSNERPAKKASSSEAPSEKAPSGEHPAK